VKIVLDEDDVMTVAKAMAKSRRIEANFDDPFPPDSTEANIWTEALLVVAALRGTQPGLN
jgi:hypothetical protein